MQLLPPWPYYTAISYMNKYIHDTSELALREILVQTPYLVVRKLRSRKGKDLGSLKSRPKSQEIFLMLRIRSEGGGGVFRSLGCAGRKHRFGFYL